LPLGSAISLSKDAQIQNNCLGYNFTIIANSTLDSFVINSTCAGDVNNLTLFINPTLLAIKNTNATGNGIFQVQGTNILASNGTSLCNGSSSNLALNTGQINITLNPQGFCYVFDNFDSVTSLPALRQVFTETQINNLYSILGLRSPTGENILAAQKNACNSFATGIGGISSKIPLILMMVMLSILIGGLSILLLYWNTGSAGNVEFDISSALPWILGIGGLIFVTIIIMVVLDTLCIL